MAIYLLKILLLMLAPIAAHAQLYSLLPDYDWRNLLCNPASTSLSAEVYAAVCGSEAPAPSTPEAVTAAPDPEAVTPAPDPEVVTAAPDPEVVTAAPDPELSSETGVEIHDLPVTLEFVSSEQWIPRSGSVTISWESTGATACTASGDWTGSQDVNGSLQMDSLTEDTTYSLVCENETNSSLAILDVYVRQATLTWEIPKTNTNGTALTDLVGYRIYWGSSSKNYDHTKYIVDAAQTSFVRELTPGTYYFAMTAKNSRGLESAFSAESSKTIY